MNQNAFTSIEGENAIADGVSRDVYSYFYKEVYKFRCAGIDTYVPSSFTADEAAKLGSIITHAFIQHNLFPIRLVKASVEYIVTDILVLSILGKRHIKGN